MNTFDRLVLHASEHKWCWQMSCTTCGCMEFRNGIELIGQGKDPLSPNIKLTSLGLLWKADEETRMARVLSLGCQAADANIEAYSDQYSSIEWMGFLGLTLERLFAPVQIAPGCDYMQNTRYENLYLVQRLISNAWCEKFLRLITKPGQAMRNHYRDSAVAICKEVLAGKREMIRVSDLSVVHEGLAAG